MDGIGKRTNEFPQVTASPAVYRAAPSANPEYLTKTALVPLLLKQTDSYGFQGELCHAGKSIHGCDPI